MTYGTLPHEGDHAPAVTVFERYAAPLFVLCALLASSVAARHAFGSLIDRWQTDDFGYGWIIPPISVAVIWSRLLQGPAGGGHSPKLAAATGLLGGMLLILGVRVGMFSVALYGCFAMLAALLWSMLGNGMMRRILAPLAYLLFAIPIPQSLFFAISFDLQIIASKFGVALARLAGVESALDGNIINLNVGSLEVAEACSGLRYILPLLSFAFFMLLLMRDRSWKKWAVVASAVPIAIGMNGVRIAMICVAAQHYGMWVAEGAIHDAEGFVVFALCVALLLGEAVWLMHLSRPAGRFIPLDDLVPLRRMPDFGDRRPQAGKANWTAGIVLLAAVAALTVGERHETPPAHIPLAMFPLRLGDVSGRPSRLDAGFLGVLQPTDYLLIDYKQDALGAPSTNLFVAYYDAQGLGTSIHNPEQCILGSGWELQSLTTVGPFADEPEFSVNRAIIARRGVREVVYYWFQGRGREETNSLAVRFHVLKDTIMAGRSDGALVRVATEEIPGEADAVAEARLAAMVISLRPSLSRFLPS
jgi:exosortase D (VPLPA-CTERM-specific)